LIVSAFLISDTLEDIKSSDQSIVIKGYAEKIIKSDLANWNCSIRASSTDMISAFAKLKSDVEKTKAYLIKSGFKQENISTSSVNTTKIFRINDEGRYTNQIIGYELEQTIKLSSQNVNLIKNISNDATVLIQDGIEIFSFPPEFFYTKLNDLKIIMLGEATKDAKVRADAMAKNSDSEVGKLKSARQGVFQITPVNSVDVSDYGEYDLSTIEKSIKAVVTVEFKIK